MSHSVWPHRRQPTRLPVPGILQSRTLERVAISFSNAWKWKVKVKSLSRVRPLVTPWTAAYQASLSVGFSRQEYWSGEPFPSPVYMYTYITSIYSFIDIYVSSLCIYMCTEIFRHTCTCIYSHICVCICVCVCVFMYIHTHIYHIFFNSPVSGS